MAVANYKFEGTYITYLLAKKEIVDIVPANSSGFDLLIINKKDFKFDSVYLSLNKWDQLHKRKKLYIVRILIVQLVLNNLN